MSFFPVKKRFYLQNHSQLRVNSTAILSLRHLKNYIDSHYRTLQDTSYIGGSSMGGIASCDGSKSSDPIQRRTLLHSSGMIHYQSDLKAFFDSRLNEMKAKQITLLNYILWLGALG